MALDIATNTTQAIMRKIPSKYLLLSYSEKRKKKIQVVKMQ